MKLTVFGSTGSVVKQVVKQALLLGHEVTAHTRHPEKLISSHKNLKVIRGDVLDPVSVEEATQGQDVVLCTLGMPIRNKDGLRSRGTANIIQAMEKTGVKRFVCLSGLGAGDSFDILPFHYRYLIFPFLLRRVFADHENQERHVRKSMLDWILVRPGNFVEGGPTGEYRHGFKAIDKSFKIKISHGDVADFMLKQLQNNNYLRQSPGLSY